MLWGLRHLQVYTFKERYIHTLKPLAPSGQYPDTDISIFSFYVSLLYFYISLYFFYTFYVNLLPFYTLGPLAPSSVHVWRERGRDIYIYMYIRTLKPLTPSSQHLATDISILYFLCKLVVFLYVAILCLYFYVNLLPFYPLGPWAPSS